MNKTDQYNRAFVRMSDAIHEFLDTAGKVGSPVKEVKVTTHPKAKKGPSRRIHVAFLKVASAFILLLLCGCRHLQGDYALGPISGDRSEDIDRKIWASYTPGMKRAMVAEREGRPVCVCAKPKVPALRYGEPTCDLCGQWWVPGVDRRGE